MSRAARFGGNQNDLLKQSKRRRELGGVGRKTARGGADVGVISRGFTLCPSRMARTGSAQAVEWCRSSGEGSLAKAGELDRRRVSVSTPRLSRKKQTIEE